MKSQRTPEQKAAWKNTLIALSKRARAMSPEEREAFARRLGIVTCEGHGLSAYNCCFLYHQCPERTPTVVGGFRQWLKAGRRVAAGEHAAGYIYVPLTGKKADADQDATAEADAQSIRFRFVPVFDVTQTEEAPTV